MKFTTVSVSPKSIALLALTFGITISLILLNHENSHPPSPHPMARSFVLWLHGLGDSGPANEPIRTFLTSAVFANAKWSFPSAPSKPAACNNLDNDQIYSAIAALFMCFTTTNMSTLLRSNFLRAS